PSTVEKNLPRCASSHPLRTRMSPTGWTASPAQPLSAADEFIDAALTWFGDPDPRTGTAWEKGGWRLLFFALDASLGRMVISSQRGAIPMPVKPAKQMRRMSRTGDGRPSAKGSQDWRARGFRYPA